MRTAAPFRVFCGKNPSSIAPRPCSAGFMPALSGSSSSSQVRRTPAPRVRKIPNLKNPNITTKNPVIPNDRPISSFRHKNFLTPRSPPPTLKNLLRSPPGACNAESTQRTRRSFFKRTNNPPTRTRLRYHHQPRQSLAQRNSAWPSAAACPQSPAPSASKASAWSKKPYLRLPHRSRPLQRIRRTLPRSPRPVH